MRGGKEILSLDGLGNPGEEVEVGEEEVEVEVVVVVVDERRIPMHSQNKCILNLG